MKRFLLLLLILTLAITAVACDKPHGDPIFSVGDGTGSGSGEDDKTPGSGDNGDDTDDTVVYAYRMGNIALKPGELLPLDKLPTPDSVAQVDSCAGDGYDNFYTFGNLEITGHPTAEGEIIYSIYFYSTEVATPEGVKPGDPFTKAVSVYGSDYSENNNTMIYTQDGVDLIFLVSDGNILSVEYMMVTE